MGPVKAFTPVCETAGSKGRSALEENSMPSEEAQTAVWFKLIGKNLPNGMDR